MIVSDRQIREAVRQEDLMIDPYEPSNVEPASIDLRMGHEFYRIQSDEEIVADSFEFPAYSFSLATTLETVEIPRNMAAIMKGRSTLGRMGILPVTAGFVDPGFRGELTLEVVNVSGKPIELEAGTRICQMVLMEVGDVGQDYKEKGGAYVDQTGATKAAENNL